MTLNSRNEVRPVPRMVVDLGYDADVLCGIVKLLRAYEPFPSCRTASRIKADIIADLETVIGHLREASE